MTRRTKKGQAAIEFLTTYGWALMAILVAIGALSYFDLLNADRYARVSCNTGGQIQCLESTIEGGDFQINLRNNYPVNVDINYIEISSPADTRRHNVVGGDNPLARGEKKIYNVGALSDAVVGNKLNVDIIINFERVGSSSNYNLSGTSTVKVIS